MTGNELLRRLRRLGQQRGVEVRLDELKGKGSHAALYYGSRRTTLKDRRKEIGPGLLRAMLRLDESIAHYRKVIALNPQAIEAYVNLADALHCTARLLVKQIPFRHRVETNRGSARGRRKNSASPQVEPLRNQLIVAAA